MALNKSIIGSYIKKTAIGNFPTPTSCPLFPLVSSQHTMCNTVILSSSNSFLGTGTISSVTNARLSSTSFWLCLMQVKSRNQTRRVQATRLLEKRITVITSQNQSHFQHTQETVSVQIASCDSSVSHRCRYFPEYRHVAQVRSDIFSITIKTINHGGFDLYFY